MEERYITKRGRKLRFGFTTGTCAALGAKAALIMLIEQKEIQEVSIETLNGWNITQKVKNISIADNSAGCSITKDAGDDPDITDGMDLYVEVSWSLSTNKPVAVTGGKGIGKVTKDGLLVPKGSYAINPGPVELITRALEPLLPRGKSVEVTISAPQGEELSEKTMNRTLGIVGGISILGTTGIVEPMSHEAVVESLKLHLSIARGEGKDRAAFHLGNYGKTFIESSVPIKEGYIIKVGNHIGDMLIAAKDYGFRHILIVGHLGKLIKVAGGIFQTHSRTADCRLEILAAHYGVYSDNIEAVKNIMKSNTTEDALQYIDVREFFDSLASTIRSRSLSLVDNAYDLDVVLFSMTRGFLGKTPGTDDAVKRMSYE